MFQQSCLYTLSAVPHLPTHLSTHFSLASGPSTPRKLFLLLQQVTSMLPNPIDTSLSSSYLNFLQHLRVNNSLHLKNTFFFGYWYVTLLAFPLPHWRLLFNLFCWFLLILWYFRTWPWVFFFSLYSFAKSSHPDMASNTIYIQIILKFISLVNTLIWAHDMHIWQFIWHLHLHI